ncbi:MAG: di-trans,poly-cis-decaprenylcistransferase [Bryobacterales bacterium]|nr:di-trans,poly-cis-decaprenylcistransferase [Bryobacterales bacterium]
MHVAIIMDGNGRWAAARGWPRLAGHRAGGEAVRRSVEAAGALDVDVLTLYAFSSDNWRRPAEETSGLLRLFEQYLRSEPAKCLEKGVRINVIGRRDRLGAPLVSAIESAERITAAARGLWLRVAVDYSSRDAILSAAERARGLAPLTRERFGALLAQASHSQGSAPEVDLLIRTGGEQRLSDFLLWECAYAELFFLDKMWPDFEAADLEACLKDFRSRSRRFGALPVAAA